MNTEGIEEPQHTKGDLWRDDDGFLAIGSGDSYHTFADLDCNDLDIDEREANKERVIKAWNCHDRFKSSLYGLMALYNSLYYDKYGEYPPSSGYYKEAEDVLNEATGK